MGNCYWVRDTMSHYGDMPPLAPTLLLIGFSLVLGLYFGLFGLGVALVRRATGSTRMALAAAPFLWAALELAAARITVVPWDQLGYSQVDNGLVNQLAPWTGVYGISFVLVAVNALIAGWSVATVAAGWLGATHRHTAWGLRSRSCTDGCRADRCAPPVPAPTATAVLIQPNLDVAGDNRWAGPANGTRTWPNSPSWLRAVQCRGPDDSFVVGRKTYIAGIPQTGAPNGEIVCPPYPTHPDLVVWPESPAPFEEGDPRFQRSLATIAQQTQAPLVVGNIGTDFSPDNGGWRFYNSALIVGADGARVGRYDKIHLVPFGEYIPFQNLLTFARKLTGRVSSFTRGDERKVFLSRMAHRYGVFICYEAVFADEVRHFAQLGAEVLVNISDDGWYGDTSAPWQHLNMARMRAIENRRWILRDTNNGVTAVIDPYGRVRQSIPRHSVDALPAQFGFRDDVTFYTAHGDVFGWLCAILGLGIVAWAAGKTLRASNYASKIQSKSGQKSKLCH